ncbi:PBECR2 nuclease fold domain-containing protein [Campylobacter hyointestinalis]|uniref:PBECR2 nuclease fold domain-containing protein n=2 Tax=Campylobacter hyointestinalis TaxID=198 RepID=UPI0007267F51|nr:PBECR2 nuclease fold domain-containing protein [Campylobacter hyointestinalis]CUU71621.1 putative DNA methylase [Campylobacter hyointestinalis subsp. hyointestinalis]CUU71803.1 putative DNA methylase [Campylobacter hyointestinalis subsp. hyointestinalis]CUU79050.1 putative DNA methylase [Campylobacter hyointestinalis subsp. hyointestinalis]
MSQGISADPLKRGETMRANFIVEKLKPLIPYLGNNEALKLHLNKAILNANGDFKLAIKNIDNIPSGNLPTPTRNLLNEFKNALKDIEQVVKSQEPTQIKSENQVNLAKTKEPTQEPVKAEAKKEIRGIHNVTYNDKKATYIKTDLENVDSAIRYANTNRDKGAKHIKIRHLMDETKPGYITNQELLNLGNSLREYIKTYKEPFIDKNGARIYEWENKEGVKFRVVVDSSRRDATTAELPQPTATDDIITFYSDRNIKDKMIFRNPKLNQTIKEAENLAKPQATPKQEPTQIKSENQVNLANQSIKGDGFVVSDENIKNLVKNISLNKYMAMQLQPKADLLNLAKDFSKVIKTPIFDSKISIDKLLNHLADKRDFNKRLEYLNLIKPTLENPLFITKENNRYRFIKTFIDSDKITKFLSVIENDNGEFLGITATPIKNTDLKNILKGDIVWGGDTLSTLNAPQIAKQEVEAIGKTIPNQTIKEAENLKTKASIQAKAKQYAKFLAETKEPTQVAPNELYKAYKAKKDLKNRKG